MGAPAEDIAAFAAQQAAKQAAQQDTVKSFAFGQGQTLVAPAEQAAETPATAQTTETEGGSAD